MTRHKIKIFVLGTRGFPDVPGGVEKHCEQLYPRLIELGCDVTVITRSSYIPPERRVKQWKGVKFIYLWSLKNKYLEAIVHTFLGIFIARFHSPDILHFHAIGPSILAPLAKALGLKVVVTDHGPDYLRQKWGKLSRRILILSERMAVEFADEMIVISSGIRELIERKYGRKDIRLIPNGVTLPERIAPGEMLERFGLKPGRYAMAACRFVPEKGLLDLIAAYKKLPDPGFQLVLAGGADHENDCSRAVKAAARRDERIVLPGFISGHPLQELFSNAGLFVLPSYYEGLPIALLEAISYGLPVLVSDIQPNREVPLPAGRYFPVGDVGRLAEQMERLFRLGITEDEKKSQRELLERLYNWDRISEETGNVYRNVLFGEGPDTLLFHE
ncbi:MAG: glycosyltransferase family 4 protein [PVC group bacterium]